VSGDEPESLRLDKWFWYARFLKSRTLARQLCESGKVRLNKTRVEKANTPVRPGDILTFPLGAFVRVVRVIALGRRRGPAAAAQTLYEDLSPPKQETRMTLRAAEPKRPPGSGRPTKRERRAVDRLREPDS